MLNPTASTAAEASALVTAQLPATDNFIFGVSKTAEEGIKQAAMINLIADSTVFVPQMTGDTTSAQVALSTAMASAEANSSYRTMAKIAESSMPLIRNAIHIVILALFPIVMLLIIVAGSQGGQVLKTYLMALLWINLWAPVYAALNFFTSWYATLGAKAAVGAMDPLSYASHQALMHSVISDQGVAGILTLSVPVIAYMLTNVSASSFTSVISGVMSPANSAAQSAGAQVGLGNSSVGNTQWGNVQMGNWSSNNRSADQWNSAPTNTYGAATDTQRLAGGASITSAGGSPGILNRSGAVANLGEVGGQFASAIATQAQTLSRNSFQRAGEASASRSNSLAAAYDTAKSFLRSAASSTGVGSNAGVGNIAQFGQAYEAAMNTASKWDAGISLSDSQKLEIMSSVSSGGGIPGVVQAQIVARGGTASQIAGTLNSARAYSESSGFKDQLSKAQSFNNAISTTSGSESARRAGSEISARLSDAEKAEQTQRVSLSQAEAYDRVASETRSGTGSAQADLSNYIVSQLGGADRANIALSSRDTAGQLALVNGHISDWVKSHAAELTQGNSSTNAGLEPAAKLGTPAPSNEPGDFFGSASGAIQSKNTIDRSHVPGNPNAAPSVTVDRDGPGGQAGQAVTPIIVERAATAGTAAAGHEVADGHSAAGQGRKTVTAPVQEATENPNIITRAGKNAFAGGKPQDGNPAAEQKNTGGTSGEW
jgi:conjugal transfer mating pair stabilization protein TraG